MLLVTKIYTSSLRVKTQIDLPQTLNESRKKKKTHNKYHIVHSFKLKNDKIRRHLMKIGFLNVVVYLQIFNV